MLKMVYLQEGTDDLGSEKVFISCSGVDIAVSRYSRERHDFADATIYVL